IVAVTTLPGPATAQDTAAIRKELEEMRKQFEAMKEGYERSINQLSERLKTLESKPPEPAPAPAAAPPATPSPSAPAVAAPPAPSPPSGSVTISPTELARPREPFALYERRGPGQMLFDMGVAGDFIGNLTQRNVQKNAGGTFSGLENRFFPREVELSLFGQVDPYARAEVRFEAGEESRGGDISVNLAEAYLELMTLPFGTQLRMGQMRNRFGLLNTLHEHDLPFIDRPNVYTQFFGQDGLVEQGAEATWVPPLPFFVEVLGGVFNGDNDVAFGRGSLQFPLVTGRVRTFFDLDEWGAFQLGASIANGQTSDQLNSQIIGVDAKYKYRPEGWQHSLFTVGGELLYSIRQVLVSDPTAAVPVQQKRTREHDGWYAYGELQPFRVGALSRWALGFRYDWTQYPANPGWEWAVQPYLSFMPSEFLRFRFGYKHTDRSQCCSYLGFQDNGGSARKVDEWLLQATFVLGAHPAHPF
ncbi:MAG TPA: hypothetical protein VFT36_10925, partial [Methylomirabilota bacterium]|nr:hypothetical protein [Methylomirabilota bacterium]